MRGRWRVEDGQDGGRILKIQASHVSRSVDFWVANAQSTCDVDMLLQLASLRRTHNGNQSISGKTLTAGLTC